MMYYLSIVATPINTHETVARVKILAWWFSLDCMNHIDMVCIQVRLDSPFHGQGYGPWHRWRMTAEVLRQLGRLPNTPNGCWFDALRSRTGKSLAKFATNSSIRMHTPN